MAIRRLLAASDFSARSERALLQARAAGLRETLASDPELLLRAGDPFQETLQAADEDRADLIAMGSHRKDILRDVFVGTTIERVIRTGHHPVLMVNRPPEAPYRRVLLAVDLSESSAHAVRSARALGLLEGA